MSKIILDLSGSKGLVERHQGDLTDTASAPNLRYLADDGQFADGLFNPMKLYGFLSPATATVASLTGTVADPINSIQYDSFGDDVYLSENGENILQLDGMDDTSVSNYLTVTSGYDIKDMLLYEINGDRAVIYAIDSNSSTLGSFVGFKMLDTSTGITVIDINEIGVNSGHTIGYEVRDTASESFGSLDGRKLAQAFNTDDMSSLGVSGIDFGISRTAGTGVGITMKVSIQTNSTAAAGAFTSRGAWSNAVTDYVKNDTVTNGGDTWQCIADHSALATANDEPGVGTDWEIYWNLFGAPSGTDVASNTFVLSTVGVYGAPSTTVRYHVSFSSTVALSASTKYWIVLEESGSVMTSSDRCAWVSTSNGNANYDQQAKIFLTSGTDIWRDINPNGDTLSANHDNFDFSLMLNRDDTWSSDAAVGAFDVEIGLTQFLYLADNGLVYWFTGNHVHTLDGGATGKVNENVLQFASYVTVADVAETRSRMYIGIQSTNKTTASDPRYFKTDKIGVYVWDRRSQIQGASDFYPCPGAQEIKSVFTSSTGDVKLITKGNSGFGEIRGISGNQFAVLHTFEKEGYPKSRRGVSQVDNMTVWLGANGIFYAYGSITNSEKPQLYKIGNMTAGVSGTLSSGPIFVGHEEATEPRIGVLFGWSDTSPQIKVQKWYPNGEGTIGVAQQALQGDIYTKVYTLPSLSTIKYIRAFHKKGTGSGSTTQATIKCYYNMSTTAAWSKVVTLDDTARGYWSKEINKNDVSFVQFEIEYPASHTISDNSYYPMYMEIEYADEGRINP